MKMRFVRRNSENTKQKKSYLSEMKYIREATDNVNTCGVIAS